MGDKVAAFRGSFGAHMRDKLDTSPFVIGETTLRLKPLIP